MKVYVVVKGPTDQAILETILREETEQVPLTFAAGGTWSGADSLARSLLLMRDEPVALVLDANTTEESLVQEQRTFLQESLREVAPEARWQVCLFVPTIEVLFFLDPNLEGVLFNQKLSAGDRLEARFRPKAVLGRVLQEQKLSWEELLHRLQKADVTALRETSPLTELREFVVQYAAGGK
ncbi:MAG: hypothetical protein L0Z62_05690 [Gemmataceae bacterium]|nr:hypothetical protein [Gemmataceae bacterium]